MNKIPFYQERKFGEKFDAVFSFMKQNWRNMIRYVLYGVLPISLIAALSMDTLFQCVLDMDNQTGNSDASFLRFCVSYGFVVLMGLLAFVWLGSLTFSYIQLYNDRENGLEGITFQDIKPYMKHNAWRIVKFGLVSLLFAIVVIGIIALGVVWDFYPLSLIVVLLCLIIFVPVVIVLPTYIFEDISIWQAYARGIRLGWHTWGGIFALGFVLSLLTNVVSMVFVMPWEVCVVIKNIFAIQDSTNPVVNSIAFSLVQYVFGVVMWVGQLVVSTLYYVSISYLYSHAAEMLDDMSVSSGIDQFDNMADANEDDDDLFATPKHIE